MMIIVTFPPDWQLYEWANALFRIQSPHPLVHKVLETNTEIGNIELHTFSCASDKDESENYTLIVQYHRLPSTELLSEPDTAGITGEILETTVEQTRELVGGEVIFTNEIRYNQKYAGKLWRIHYNKGESVLKCKSFIVQDRYYLIQVYIDARSSLSPVVDRFLDSFQLIEPKNSY